MQETPIHRFLTRLQVSLENNVFVKLSLGHPSDPAGPLRRLLLRPVIIRGEKCISVVSRFTSRDETKNCTFAETIALITAKLGVEFLSGHLFTEQEEVQLELGRKNRLKIKAVKTEPALMEHDRSKSRWVDSHARFLQLLGVTDPEGKVRERMGDKFRQIERFVDLLASAFRETDLATRPADQPITMCDMGAGKGYLTFSAYDYFQRIAKVNATVIGVETRPDLVTLCNKAAVDCGFTGLQFVQSVIEEFPLPALDVLVALHACNTATDDALAAGLNAGAQIILVAPCCHKEVRPQVDAMSASGPLSDILRHGIFAERHAEIATDALRALLLERAGYRVRVSEFVAAEHTAKNVMIIATKRHASPSTVETDDLNQRISELKNFYGIQHHRLEQILMDGRELGCAETAPGAVPCVC